MSTAAARTRGSDCAHSARLFRHHPHKARVLAHGRAVFGRVHAGAGGGLQGFAAEDQVDVVGLALLVFRFSASTFMEQSSQGRSWNATLTSSLPLATSSLRTSTAIAPFEAANFVRKSHPRICASSFVLASMMWPTAWPPQNSPLAVAEAPEPILLHHGRVAHQLAFGPLAADCVSSSSLQIHKS